jgi:hypothetical protein
MNYKLHIPFINREDLLRDAVESTRAIGNVHVWAGAGLPSPDIAGVTHHRLPPMSAVDTINMMIQSSWDDDVMFWAHNDCFAHPGVAEGFLAYVQTLDGQWGLCETLYDVLCAFNMKAVREVGYWDPMFFQYTADPDYYYRLKVAGYRTAQFPNGRDGRVEHRGSMTVRSDKLFNHRVQFRERTKFDKAYYALKWGGLPGGERFQRAFADFK